MAETFTAADFEARTFTAEDFSVKPFTEADFQTVPDLTEFDRVLKAPDEPSFWQRLRESKLARSFFGATTEERKAMLPSGGGLQGKGLFDVVEGLAGALSMPRPLAEEIRTITEPLVLQAENISPTAAGIASGTREAAIGLATPALPLATGPILAEFGREYLANLPEAIRMYNEAKQLNNEKQAAEIATKTIVEGALLLAGGAHRTLAPKTSAALNEVTKGEPNAQSIRESTGQLEETRPQPERVQENRINVVEQASPEQPQPLAQKEEPLGGRSAELRSAEETISIKLQNIRELSKDLSGYMPTVMEDLVQWIRQSARDPELRSGVPEAMQEIANAAQKQGIPIDKVDAALRKELSLTYGADAPEMAQYFFGSKAKALPSPESNQPLGITPSPFLQKVIDYFRPRETEATPEVQIDVEHRVPRLQPYEQEKTIASNPESLARVPIAGRVLDPRYAAREPVDQAIITRAYSTQKGQTFAALWAETQNRSAELFPVERESGTITLTDGSRGYLSDVIEAEMASPGSQPITEAQRNWIRNEWEPLKTDVETMLREEGVKEFSISEDETAEVGAPYFPRPAVGKRTEEPPTSVGGGKSIPGAKPFFLKKRLYETEQAGATGEQQIIYDPDFLSRASRYISGAYRAVADTRLANDQSLGGRTPLDRYALLREQHESTLNQLEGDALAEFEAQLRETAAHPVWLKEAQVNVGPAFTGKIYPAEIANKLQRAYGESSHDWVRKAATITDAAKAMKLTADMSAPFTQGLAMMFRHPTRWAKSTGNSYISLFRDDVVAKVLENPEYLQAAQEFTQSGGSFLRLQDFMAGAERGKFATRIPILGKVIERTGVAYGTFLDLAKLEMWRAWKEGAPKDQWSAIAESIENSLFMGRMEQTGLSPGRALAERLMAMAPAYYRGAGGLVSTAFQRGVSGKMSRQMLASYGAGVTLTAMAAYAALGLSEEEILRRLNPSSGKFLKVPLPSGEGRNVEVGFGNVLSSVVRLLGEAVEYHKSDKPIDTGVEQNPYLRFLRAKAAFLPALGIDAATGRDYFGNQLTIKDSLVRAFTPLVISQLFHNEKATTSQKLADAMFSFMGIQSFPEDKRSMFVRERENLSAQKFKKPYSELRFPQKAIITRELERQDRFKRDDPTPKQIEAAFAKDIERLTELRKMLTAENRIKLDRMGVKIPGYQNSISINGVTVPLTEKEQEHYKTLLAEEYNRAIKGMPEMTNLTGFRRQEVTDRRMAIAKQRARTRLIAGK